MGIATDFVLILVAGLFGGILARALRLPLLVGYVLAGIFVGPYTAGPTVVQIHDIELLAEIGAALLLFALGLEVSFGDLQPVRRVALIGGPIQILSICVLGAVAGSYGLHLPRAEAIWFGAMISLSSTMVVVKILSAGGVTSTLASRIMIGLLVIQDLAVIPMLIILPQLNNPAGMFPRLARSLAIATVCLVSIFLLGTRMLPRLLKSILAWGSRELFLVTVVTIGVGIGFAAYTAGLSFALGAFVAGIILSESEFSHQALSEVVPLRDIFGLLFFVTVGMLFDPAFAMQHALQIIMVVATIFVGKALIIGGVTRLFGYHNMAPWIVGLGLSQIGEFSFVLARIGFSTGSLAKPTYDLALTCTIVTMAFAPLVSAMALPLGRGWRSWRKSAAPDPQSSQVEKAIAPHRVILAGYGRAGRAVARALVEAEISFIVVELNHALMTDLASAGYAAIWGDITRDEILRAARAEHARMLLLTMPDQSTVQLAIRRARAVNPALFVIARAAREHHVEQLRQLGVAVVQPEFEGGVEMVRQALLRCNYNEPSTALILHRLREELYRSASAST